MVGSTGTFAPVCSFGRKRKKRKEQSDHGAAAGQRPAKCELVGELQVAAHRQPGRNARHGETGDIAQHPHQIRPRSPHPSVFRIGRDDHLRDIHAVDTLTNPVE